VLIGSHGQRGTIYADGSYDTRWHEQAGCGCRFDVHYFHVHTSADASVADSVTIVYNPAP
jgi:nitrous oxidase accessory protein NosD